MTDAPDWAKPLIADAAENKSLLIAQIEILERIEGIMKLILAATGGDGSDELVAILRRLSEAVEGVGKRMDVLPEAVASEVAKH